MIDDLKELVAERPPRGFATLLASKLWLWAVNMKRIVLALCSTAMLGGAPAVAADAASVTPFNWSGVYLGVDAGYGWGSTVHKFSNGAPTGTSNPSGVLGGIYAGYDYQFSNFVLGVEADAEAAALSGGNFIDNSGIGSTGSARMNWDASIRGRFGTAFGSSLLYMTGGIAFAGYRFGGGPAFIPPPPCCGYSSTVAGWTIGGGLERAFGRHFSARIEYRYTDFGGASGRLPPTFPGVTMPTRSTMQVARVGLSYRY